MRLCFSALALLAAALLTPHPGAAEPTEPGASDTRAVTRVIFGSCAGVRGDAHQAFWAPILKAEPDVFIFAGDNVYGDTRSGALDEMEEAYRTLLAEPEFRQLKSQARVLATWDDHDYGLNDGDRTYVHKKAAERLFEKTFAAPEGSGRDSRPGVYDSMLTGPEGQRLQIILLDTRFFRSPFKDERDVFGRTRWPYTPIKAEDRTMLGEAQWEWLEDQLKKPADLRLIVSSVQVLATAHPFERWGVFPAERQRLFDLIASTKANGVVFLSGDRHLGALYERPALNERGAPYPLHEITSSSLNKPLSGWGKPGDGPDPLRPEATFIDENYGQIDVDWAKGTVTLSLRRLDGRAVRDETVGLETLKAKTPKKKTYTR